MRSLIATFLAFAFGASSAVAETLARETVLEQINSQPLVAVFLFSDADAADVAPASATEIAVLEQSEDKIDVSHCRQNECTSGWIMNPPTHVLTFEEIFDRVVFAGTLNFVHMRSDAYTSALEFISQSDAVHLRLDGGELLTYYRHWPPPEAN